MIRRFFHIDPTWERDPNWHKGGYAHPMLPSSGYHPPDFYRIWIGAIVCLAISFSVSAGQFLGLLPAYVTWINIAVIGFATACLTRTHLYSSKQWGATNAQIQVEVERTLQQHQPDVMGWCKGCDYRWPCDEYGMALIIQDLKDTRSLGRMRKVLRRILAQKKAPEE